MIRTKPAKRRYDATLSQSGALSQQQYLGYEQCRVRQHRAFEQVEELQRQSCEHTEMSLLRMVAQSLLPGKTSEQAVVPYTCCCRTNLSST